MKVLLISTMNFFDIRHFVRKVLDEMYVLNKVNAQDKKKNRS